MLRKLTRARLLKMAACLCAAGMLFASSCAMQDMRAVVAGFDAAASYLEGQDNHDDNISFGDWLADELEDL